MLKLVPDTLETYLLDILVEPCLPVHVAGAAEKVEVSMGALADSFPKCSRLDAFLSELLL